MIDATALSSTLAEYLGAHTEASQVGGRVCLLTPVEYPDCDAVSVWVEQDTNQRLAVSDLAAGDARLIGTFGATAARNRAERIAERFDVEFRAGSFLAYGDRDTVADVCWRVAQASAALADTATFQQPDAPRRAFTDVVYDVIRARTDVERNHPLNGVSGHTYSTSIFVPSTEVVLEPIMAGRRMFNRAQLVAAEFTDLRAVNGYRLVAVLEEGDEQADEAARLLTQVADVARWTDDNAWIDTALGLN